jgi:antitoxin YokJ
MTPIEQLLNTIRSLPDCQVLDPLGFPNLRNGDDLPCDLHEFYRRCGGVRLFMSATYPIAIVRPADLTRANPEIVDDESPDDISDTWYIVGRGGLEEMISIDCHPGRLGTCYDSFWDRHGVAGDCAVLAESFTELVQRLVDARGGYWYWLEDSFAGYGDAYD